MCKAKKYCVNIIVISQHLFPIQTPRAHRTTELIKELSIRGHSVTLFAVLGSYDYSSFSKKYDIKIKPISIYYQSKTYNSDGLKKRHMIDKILGRLLGKIFEFPNIEFKNRIPEIFKDVNKFDMLISISDPHHIHWGCAKAKIKYPQNFPKTWIADCGDPFMENGKTKDHYRYYSKYEKEFCSLCEYITVPVKQAKLAYYKDFHHKIKVIPQGFKFKLNHKVSKPSNDVVTFLFAGTFVPRIRNPQFFFEYLCSIPIQFKFYIFTPYTNLIDKYIDPLKDKIVVRDFIPRNDLMSFINKMDFVINFENSNAESQLPSKLIDYAISKKPILSVNCDSKDFQKTDEFLNRNYSKQLIIKNVEKYHIENVVDQFLSLCQL